MDPGASVVLQAGFSVCGVCSQRSMLLRQSTLEPPAPATAASAPAPPAPQRFLQCAVCKQCLSLPKYGEVTALVTSHPTPDQPVICPICRHQVLTVSRASADPADPRKKTSYHVCSYCFR